MASPPTIDIDRYLQPISEESPSGPPAREDPDLSRSFYAIREARNAALNAEKMIAKFALMTDEEVQQELAGRSDDPRRPPDWDKVFSLSEQLLTQQSKDLWVVSWLVESAVRLEGIFGLRDGLELCTSITEKFWNSVHPRPEEDEDGARYTLSQLEGLNNSLPAVIEASPILLTDGRFTWSGYRDALIIESDPPEIRSMKLDEGALSLEMYRTAMRQVGAAALSDIKEDIEQALAACSRFDTVLQETCGRDSEGYIAPSILKITECLKKIQIDFNEMSEAVVGPSEDTASNETAMVEKASGPSVAVGAAKPLMSREDAFQHLLKVADYFRKTEPHSPVSYALEQAVRWGRMPLPELLKDLVGDSDTLNNMFKRMGIIPPKTDDY